MEDKNSTIGVRTWIEVDSKAIQQNIQEFKKVIPAQTKFCAVVKSNAYGHGLVDFSKTAQSMDVDWLAVDSITEGLRLRKEGVTKPILVLGYTLPEMLEKAVDADISIALSHNGYFEAISQMPKGKKIKVHIKVDSGMHRQGFLLREADVVIAELGKLSDKVAVEGLFTHFAAAKNPAFPQATLGQLSVFNQWVTKIKVAGFSPIVHAAATSATILFPEAHFDMVRIGIGLYGLWPSAETQAFAKDRIKLKPTLTWKTLVGEVKDLPRGERIGYDFTEEIYRDSKVAICPVGYWHGIPRCLSSVGRVIINGVLCKILGRVAMDMIIVDVTDASAKIGDEVVIIGEQMPAEEMARLADASWYEILTRINPLIRKIYK